ncbi:MAG: hypothetical protein ACTTHU_06290 [Treponema sp.]
MKIKHLCAGAFAALALALTGCSNALTDAGRIAGSDAPCTVSFSVANIPTDYAKMINYAQNPNARTILPNAPFDFSSGLTFMLEGTSNSGGTYKEVVTLDGTHKFKETLSARVWDLTLTAYKSFNPSHSHHQPVLQANCMADLTNGDAQVTFNMSTKGLKTPGTVKVTGTVSDPDNICAKYKISICDAYSGKLIDKYVDIDGTTLNNTNAEQEHDTAAHTTQFDFHYGDTTSPTPADHQVKLNPGAYSFMMVFYKNGTASGTLVPIGNYVDTIVVNPGNDLVQTVQPNPLDVLMKKPTAPKNLRAYLVEGTEDTEGNYYCTKLTWDSSMFETNYELELSTYSDDGNVVDTTKTYGFKAINNAVDENFAGSEIRYGGSLISGSHECTLKLELGKVYEVRLRACNSLGQSAWIKRDVAAATSVPAGYKFFDIPASSTDKKHINRRRLRYNLNGGKLTLGTGATPPNIKEGIYIEYGSYSGTETDLLKITPSIPAPPAGSNTLVKQSGSTPPYTITEFAGWLNPNTGAAVSYDHSTPGVAAHVDFYKHINVDLTTNFGNNLEGTVEIPAPIVDIPDGKIKITYDKDGGSSPQNPTLIGTHYVIPKKLPPPGGEITFITVKFNGLSPSNEYTDMECTAYFTAGPAVSAVNLFSAADGNSCKFSTGTYPTQTFTLKVSALNQSHVRLSRTFLIDLQN